MSSPKIRDPREEDEDLLDIQENHREDCFRRFVLQGFAALAQSLSPQCCYAAYAYEAFALKVSIHA